MHVPNCAQGSNDGTSAQQEAAGPHSAVDPSVSTGSGASDAALDQPSQSKESEDKGPDTKEEGGQKKKKGGKWKWILGSIVSVFAIPYFTIEYQLLDKLQPKKSEEELAEEEERRKAAVYNEEALTEALAGKQIQDLNVVLYQV